MDDLGRVTEGGLEGADVNFTHDPREESAGGAEAETENLGFRVKVQGTGEGAHLGGIGEMLPEEGFDFVVCKPCGQIGREGARGFARGVGEYGSVIFIAGNIPQVTEIAPLLIVIKLEEFDYVGATAIATIMLAISFAILLLINLIQAWSRKRYGHGA